MNKKNLHLIFDNYIEKFEHTTSPECDESYKWRIAHRFHDLMDPESPSFAAGLKDAQRLSANLIDSGHRFCFSALVACAEQEPESVRALFKVLFADDGGDLTVRKEKIERFIKDANALTSRLHSSSAVFMNDWRSAMGYLFLYDPDNHYLYKATEANSFASCIEFYDDWGAGANFKMEVYYRMCDNLVEEIRGSEALLATNEGRFYDKDGVRLEGMHPDVNYHILAFDIIYGAPESRYNFYEGIPYSDITAKARRVHEERRKKAEELRAKVVIAREQADLLAEAKEYFAECVAVGVVVKHNTWGEGVITEVGEKTFRVAFADGLVKPLGLASVHMGGILTLDVPDFEENVEKYKDVMRDELSVARALDRAEKEYAPYSEYDE